MYLEERPYMPLGILRPLCSLTRLSRKKGLFHFFLRYELISKKKGLYRVGLLLRLLAFCECMQEPQTLCGTLWFRNPCEPTWRVKQVAKKETNFHLCSSIISVCIVNNVVEEMLPWELEPFCVPTVMQHSFLLVLNVESMIRFSLKNYWILLTFYFLLFILFRPVKEDGIEEGASVWHEECFMCSRCQVQLTLAKKPQIDGETIVCQSCVQRSSTVISKKSRVPSMIINSTGFELILILLTFFL